MRKLFTERRFLLGSFTVAAAFVVGGALWATVALWNISQPLILNFNSIEGITHTGSLANLAQIAEISLGAFMINFALALSLEDRDWFLSRLIVWTTLFLSALLFWGFTIIISVN